MPLKLNGYSAHICCNGKEMDMYGVQRPDAKTVSCWIASKEGKSFTVHWADETGETVMGVETFMDGRLVDDDAHDKRREGECLGFYVTGQQMRPFIFSSLNLTDSDNDEHATQTVPSELGTIRVVMTRVQEYRDSDEVFVAPAVSAIGSIDERSKKAGSHAVSMGDIKEIEALNITKVHTIGEEEEPFATFIFRYRPLAHLQANNIVPLPPRSSTKRPADTREATAASGPSNRKHRRTNEYVKKEEESDGEEDELLLEIQDQLTKLQRRLEEARAARRARAVKRDPSPIHVPVSSSDEVIDLTSD
ncbi:hypothetical protein C8Q70DRAFT_945043 [Cubamyces menziesii]|nr:hypothetical protein C8Q70DRAFT_945043 [Cubamyces menziesii]